jgi:spermidine synthase
LVSGKRIKGVIVSHWRDDMGEIVVSDDEGTRSLYFGDVLQSSILLNRPEALIEDYNLAIVSALIFNDNPHTVLLIGLGGCSLVHFLLNAFPECIIDVAEIREKVIDLAHDFFLLPRETSRLRIFHTAGQDFMGRQRDSDNRYDLIIVDAFDESGPAASLLEKDFLTACLQRLKKDGVFAVNLWSRPKDNFPGLYASVREVFGSNTLKLLLSEAYWNAIVFGSAHPEFFNNLPSYRQKAKALQQKYGINFPKYLKCLYWQNFRNSPSKYE